MNLQQWNMREREYAVSVWLEDMARRVAPWRKWKRVIARQQYRDAYERGYNHGMIDQKTGQTRPPP